MVNLLELISQTKKFRTLLYPLRDGLDNSSEAGRANARHRAITLTVLTSFFARCVSIVTTLISLPLTLHYLGPERFGMWTTLSAFSLLLSFTDLGIGNSALTAIAQGTGRQNKLHLSRIVSSSYIAMSLIAGAILITFATTYPFVKWDRLFNVSTPIAIDEAGPAAAVFFVILALAGPIGLVHRIQSGLQDGFRSSLWQSAANVAALLALVIATQSHASLPWLVLAIAGTPILVSLVNSIDFFLFRRSDIRPRLSFVEHSTMRRLSCDGVLFLVLQACVGVMFSVNPMIVAQVLDAKAVASFAVPERLFNVVGAILGIALNPLWPAYGDATARGDLAWVKLTLKRSLMLSIASAAVLGVILVILGPTLIDWWVRGAVAVPLAVFAGLGIWKVMEATGHAVVMFLNGANQLTVQVACAVVTAVASVALKVWFTSHIGIAGIPLGMILAYGIFTMPFLSLAVRRALSQLHAGTKGP